jgi:hemoglobin-like flavoprotein
MTPHQITLVRDSFRTVLTIRDAAAALFYQNLFERAPSLLPMFAHTDMSAQGAKLMAAIGFVVQGLTNPAAIAGPVRELAQRHEGYGVEPRHYDIVGAALIDTLAGGLGEAFTDEVRVAWIAAYDALVGMMLDRTAAAA